MSSLEDFVLIGERRFGEDSGPEGPLDIMSITTCSTLVAYGCTFTFCIVFNIPFACLRTRKCSQKYRPRTVGPGSIF